MQDLVNMTEEELRDEVVRLRKRKKYGLVWEDKTEEIAERCKSESPVLTEVVSREVATDPDKPVNLLIEGDNYHALSVLNYTHHGKIDVIYIDPPYNTGARDWKYNNDYVDGEDSFRHSKWIAFMSKRLLLAKNLLTNTGVICVTIDDHELPRLWMLLEEVFGEENHLGTVAIRNNPIGRMTQRKISLTHEYGIFFGKSDQAKIAKLPADPSEKSHKYLKDEIGFYTETQFRMQGSGSHGKDANGNYKPKYYPIYVDSKTGKISATKKFDVEIFPIDSNGEARVWKKPKSMVENLYESGDLLVKKRKGEYQLNVKFRGGAHERKSKSLWIDAKFSAKDHGTRDLTSLLGERNLFDYPKSIHAVMESIMVSSDSHNSIILDFFAGSGTTGHAVLELNKQDGGNRRFILCTNNENKIAEQVTHKRIKKVIKGYRKNGDGEKVASLGGNLKYYRTAFVAGGESDISKIKLTEKATEMLCIKEGTFELVKKTKETKTYKIYRNAEQHTAIIFTESAIANAKKVIAAIEGKCAVYLFTLGSDVDTDAFDDLPNVRVEAIPESILKIYRKIFKPQRGKR